MLQVIRAQNLDMAVVLTAPMGMEQIAINALQHGADDYLPTLPRPDWSPDDTAALPEGGFGISIIQSVFPLVRTVTRPGEFGLEMALTF